MFDSAALHGFVNTLTVQTAALNAGAAVAAMVRTAEAARDRVLGGTPKPSGYRQIVDGAEGAALDTVRPDGVIVFAWQYLLEVVREIYDGLVIRSPRETGEYIAGLLILADGQPSAIDQIDGSVQQVHIVASVDYARRLEVGKRKDGGPFVIQVPPHIVEETALVARRLYGDLAAISFTYISLSDAYQLRTSASHRKRHGRLITEVEYPAILITPRTA